MLKTPNPFSYIKAFRALCGCCESARFDILTNKNDLFQHVISVCESVSVVSKHFTMRVRVYIRACAPAIYTSHISQPHKIDKYIRKEPLLKCEIVREMAVRNENNKILGVNYGK